MDIKEIRKQIREELSHYSGPSVDFSTGGKRGHLRRIMKKLNKKEKPLPEEIAWATENTPVEFIPEYSKQIFSDLNKDRQPHYTDIIWASEVIPEKFIPAYRSFLVKYLPRNFKQMNEFDFNWALKYDKEYFEKAFKKFAELHIDVNNFDFAEYILEWISENMLEELKLYYPEYLAKKFVDNLFKEWLDRNLTKTEKNWIKKYGKKEFMEEVTKLMNPNNIQKEKFFQVMSKNIFDFLK